MNCTVYIFGNLSSGYTQYPEDFSKDIFEQLYSKSKASTQLIVHRENNCMFYTYLRKLGAGKHIGLCIQLNDLMLTQLDKVFELFESAISKMVEKGYLIKYSNDGEIVPNAGQLYKNKEEVDFVTRHLKFRLNNFDGISKKLPPKNFGNHRLSTKEFVVDDDAVQILEATYSYGYTFIYKSKNYNTVQMTSYKGVLATITKENEKLKEENKKILLQKKQIKFIVVLLVFFIGRHRLHSLAKQQPEFDTRRSQHNKQGT